MLTGSHEPDATPDRGLTMEGLPVRAALLICSKEVALPLESEVGAEQRHQGRRAEGGKGGSDMQADVARR